VENLNLNLVFAHQLEEKKVNDNKFPQSRFNLTLLPEKERTIKTHKQFSAKTFFHRNDIENKTRNKLVASSSGKNAKLSVKTAK
jgi:hypothetical protein